ncbi:aromatic ring-hydroxylating dioxygenase subunit alpha [Novosphingobium umbonatum]|uniref:Aromatic ring-hydroxylating dioxygenase subunit alpha n=1 Tax=Novosphingobium umbonatum TaxID=1908524 RepID=A0A437N725_9SPHN|nr:aromatic ring-hydroxylating dioxygenase subunit alpha [Novosphingobium umbonatum]RVU05698.1 aromatic ring-hydroxylating dioxygenase subunit alpha [Novosphingobium umbonatum]
MSHAVLEHGLPRPASAEEIASARCPAPSMQEIVAGDTVPPPPVLAHEEPAYLGSEPVKVDRYFDQSIFEAEIEKIWKKSWQWVCREDHIPEPGDNYTYEVAHLSYLVVRQEDGSVKGFVNSCLHRATKFKRSEGIGMGDQIRCPYHGWSWNNDGSLKAVPCSWDFGHICPSKMALPEVRVGHWGGFIFINPSPEGPSLEDFLSPLPEHFAHWDIANRYVSVHVAKELPCNWKTAQEAFLESYHVMETHPQLMKGVGDANVQYDIHSDHITRFYAASGVNSPHLANPLSEQELLATMILGDQNSRDDSLTVKEGETARNVMARHLRKVMGEAYQCDLSHLSDSEVIDTIEYHIFPNMVLFPGLSLPMAYRFRPIGSDPNRTLFEILFLRPNPSEGRIPEPPEPYRVAEKESYSSAPGFDAAMGYVYDQDTDNLRAQQEGFRASATGVQQLGNYQEVRIRHFQQVIDKYLNA